MSTILSKWMWSLYSKFYDQLLFSPLYRHLLEDVVSHLDLNHASNLLDAGCGTGNIELLINEKPDCKLKIEAIDSSERMLTIAKKKNKGNLDIHFCFASLNENLEDYEDSFFDRVAMIHVLYALENPHNTLCEIYRVMQKNSVIVLANPREDASLSKLMRANLPYFNFSEKMLFLMRMFPVILLNTLIAYYGRKRIYHFWNKSEWETVLEEIGFSLVLIETTYGGESYLIKAIK